jgi:hypothetical protein
MILQQKGVGGYLWWEENFWASKVLVPRKCWWCRKCLGRVWSNAVRREGGGPAEAKEHVGTGSRR